MPQVPSPIPPITSETSTPAYPAEPPTRLPSKFIATVRCSESAKKHHHLSNENVLAVQRASIILLACKPYMVNEIMSKP
ncbi:hypothetical protein BGAL_0394g00110 [Botrytis galanthina]|uniref:Uncharacterized protein n=1 Tax=Botrytis galanthina TaxID=278940 RepID=A0A4S8QZT6_9HELO|nr:hypothetical protein BGAL_0394g00110 [Botrytis galanthina]